MSLRDSSAPRGEEIIAPIRVRTSSAGNRAAAPRPPRRWKTAAALLLTAALTAAGIWWIGHLSPQPIAAPPAAPQAETPPPSAAPAPSAQAQTRLISDLLDVSRIVSGKLRLEVQPLDLEPVIEVERTLAGLGTLIYRLNFVLELFQRGSEAAAVVEDVGVWRRYLTLHLVYTVRGQCYFHALNLLSTQRALALSKRDEVIVLYDPDNPRRVLVKDLYL